MKRLRVRGDNKTWNDPGPDLLRQTANAREQLRTLIRKADGNPLFVKVDGKENNGPTDDGMNRAQALDLFDRGFKDELRVSDKDGLLAVVKVVECPLKPTSSVSVSTEVARTLIEAQFPGIKFAGGYVWKETSPGYWSDHAWGTAIDETENKAQGVHNDEVFSWCTRMAASGNMPCAYILGSRDGKVVSSSAPDWQVEPSGASDSHLWHNHLSIVDHDGRKPPKTGGVF